MIPSQQLLELIHEMRNELAVARANLEGLVDGKLSPTRERLLGIIQALSQVDSLIDDLRATDPDVRTRVRPSLTNVCELLNREYTAVDALAQAKDIKFTVQQCAVTAPECMRFYGDPVRIGQIVKNVLLNAIRYTPKGGTVSVDCSRLGDELQVQISDSGPGISEEEAAAVFEPGFRGSASAGNEGSGYGLAVVKQLVEAHGGSVTAAEATARGATFTVRLPGVPADPWLCDTCRASQGPAREKRSRA